jgi:hypothetical protein
VRNENKGQEEKEKTNKRPKKTYEIKQQKDGRHK